MSAANAKYRHPLQLMPKQPCIICRCERFRNLLSIDNWHYRECRNCGLVALHPRPSAETLMRYYDGYLPEDDAAIRRWQDLIAPVVDASARLITARRQRTGRLLDIGCGFGFFLERMWREGWSVEGIEVSPSGRRYARRRWGLEVHAHPLEELELDAGRYDVVTLFYVIEHVSDPVQVLAAVKRILKPGGMVVLRWPHTTPIVKLLKPWSRRLDLYHTPYHLYDFTPSTMTALLEATGFKAVETIIGGHTLPADPLNRWTTIACGHLAQALLPVSRGRWLLPGVSKTTVARV